MSRMIGVDVGGTFTDVFVLDEASGTADVSKVPTTRPGQSGGFLDGIARQVDDLSTVNVVVHGTTAGTNALLERKGAKIGIITTRGLRDVLEMRRRDRPRTWGLRGAFDPVVPRDLRLEVSERTLADGTVRTPVDLDEVRAAVGTLLAADCLAVAILFANSYANSENEQKAVEAVREIWPNPHVSASAEILPEIREFERFSTTSLNAYLQPEVSGYLDQLDTALKGGGFGGEFMIVQSNGGVMGTDTACRLPVRTALSGPAAGVIAAGYIAQTAGFDNVITGDIGGTSFDVALISDGKSMLSQQTSIDFGMVVRAPMIEITTIGAGGGSIAWVDPGGFLNIGPESAGSTPGPVAYGQGNTRPTVTDANVVLGRIDPDSPIGGKLDRLDVEAAARAIDDHVGTKLNLSTEAAAEAILRVANSRMAGAIRLVSIERGFDPKRFAFMPFGGGGALHAGAILQDVGIARAIIPRYPGVTSAMGCVIADMRQDFVQTINSLTATLDVDVLGNWLQGHVDAGMALLDAAQSRFEAREIEVELDMAYVGQTHTVAVPLKVAVKDRTVEPATVAAIEAAFDAAYAATFGRLLKNGARRVMNLRTAVIGKRPRFDLATLAPEGGNVEASKTGNRQVHFGNAWHDTAIYDRLSLPVGSEIEGPAILVQPDTTILIDPGLTGCVDSFGNTIIEPSEA
ncbi:hydantoinase/oxoprolinase family protein [Roseobacter sp. HKCCD9010]|uniref:hydantoinase/oxoprolinase family protein n=1 Tax=unclassified Roseobacter TaxID=196798 RepID=UPI00149247FC|nr:MULTISPECIES: hydantoinase/oxoprolinase family protein [unclassified Roseobacter]MBF9052078.1 hydantoinase/oxoprolinase family protein [Rhodobacterales bacterium HKCCD4356]NNV14000.1 hydantoinase/oxoprolinase family protein [Roseobacter sp. HKCCD7357]NNV18241.1 hydantoinase/oxoprolinase family protein [Roseobacter sp. HKCCD8768]NNV27699.1 hydantoinase/oxoprolinase family protein [Roseobacter sp. HKCCD8192]NNV31942.1 hydantoinase/oxoprolinase family protein [Roseobacter sp. HKCCD9061]